MKVIEPIVPLVRFVTIPFGVTRGIALPVSE